MEKEKKIIQGAAEVFMTYGVKSVNMDDVARNLGISKKTLYKFVKDKNELVSRAVRFHCDVEDNAIEKICKKGLNAIDEMFEISHFVVALLRKVHPSIHFDMEKYHPEVWKEMIESRNKTVYKCMYENLEKGKRNGLYRENLNSDIIARMYMAKMDSLFDGQIFPPGQFKFEEVYLEYFRYHIRGLASEKGIEYLIEKMKNE